MITSVFMNRIEEDSMHHLVFEFVTIIRVNVLH
jgi:hypothetical protein